MKTVRCPVIVLVVLFFLAVPSIPLAAQADWNSAGQQALTKAFSQIGSDKGDSNLLVLTNAGYSRINGDSTETFIDTAAKTTGCSLGTRSLLTVHSSILDPLWFSLYQRDTGKLVFVQWTGDNFEQKVVDGSPENILTPEGWEKASSLIGPKAFSVVSISMTWAVDPPWTLLMSALFHDHFCPGVNAGYIGGEYLRANMPLGPGEKYVFVNAPSKCPADALQVMFNTTPGKAGGYSMDIGGQALDAYARDGVQPFVAAMSINQKTDVCQGMVLGFDWNQAYLDTGVKSEELAPAGGRKNPMFWLARIKMSRELASMSPEKLSLLIKELKTFSGPASLVKQIAGRDPYGVIWEK